MGLMARGVCLHSWEIELLLSWGKNMDNFLASVRGQPADGVWEANSWLQQGISDTSDLASGCSGVVVAVPRWSSGAEGRSAHWTFALSIHFTCVNCHWRALGIQSWFQKLLIPKTPGHSCPRFRYGVCLTSTLQTQVAIDVRVHFPQCPCSLELLEQRLMQDVLVCKKIGWVSM